MKKKWICVGISLLLLLVGCGKPEKPISGSAFLLDTYVSIKLYDNPRPDILDGALALCEQYERLFSRTDPESEIYRLNHAGGEVFAVSEDTRVLLSKALYYSGLTNGKYDITVCSVMDLWNFTSENPVCPEPKAVETALSRVDWENVELNENTVRLHNGAQIDLGSIAKGYIADRLGEYLKEKGVSSAVIDLGGNVLTVGEKAPDTPFVVGIQKPFEQRTEMIGTVEVSGYSVVSSGIYERCFRQDGELYHHILDPETGYPVHNEVVGVTVITPLSVDGDALSTCLFLLGIEDGIALVESLPDAEAVFITQDGGQYVTSGLVEKFYYKPLENE